MSRTASRKRSSSTGGLAPGTQLVDVSHAIAPQNILEGAFVLAGIIDAFPPGTVHLAVIDPGVGTDRRMIAALVADQLARLPAPYRDVIVLRNLEGLPFDEVAVRMNRSPGAVRVDESRGLPRS